MKEIIYLTFISFIIFTVNCNKKKENAISWDNEQKLWFSCEKHEDIQKCYYFYENKKPKRIEVLNNNGKLLFWKEWDLRGKIIGEDKIRNNIIRGDMWYSNGKMMQKGKYFDGIWDGYWIFWHEKGMKKMEGCYDKGNKIGKHYKWDENGNLSILYFDGRGELNKVQKINMN